jgi:H+-translocating NAD(P) transhydrogenase subunit alpha
MLIGVPRESYPGENRVSLIPSDVKKLTKLGAEVLIETASGANAGFADEEYVQSGARISASREELFSASDIILRLRKTAD